MVAQIIDQWGNPVSSQNLSEEVAYPTERGRRRTIEDAEAAGLRPQKLARIMKQSATYDPRPYLTLAEEMEERYLHYSSQLQTRRLAVEGVDPTLEVPEGVSTKIVDAVQALIDKSRFDNMCASLGDGVAKGYAVSEMIWEYEEGVLQPVEYKWRDPRFFQFDRVDYTKLLLADDSTLDGLELEHGKFIRHMPRSKSGIPIRAGLARPAAWAFLIQSFGLQDWVAFSEVYGLPLRVGRYGNNATANEKRTLLRAVKSIANDAAAIIPQGMDMEFIKVEGQHGAAVFSGLMDYVDKQVSKIVLGQTMTSDDGSSMAQAVVHNDVRIDIKRADCKQLAQTINQELIETFVAFNFGPQDAYPLVTFPVPDPEDTEKLARSVASLVPYGFKVSQREMRDKMGLSDPKDDDELLMSPSAAAGAAGAPTELPQSDPPALRPNDGGKANLDADPTTGLDTDALLHELFEQASGDWSEISEPLLKPFQTILEKAGSLEEAMQMLQASELDAGPLIESLAKATAISRGLGDVSD